MNQAIEKVIYSALSRNERAAGIGSSATTNEIIEGVKPYYQVASDSEKEVITERLNKLKIEPGVPIPSNIEQLLSN